MTSVEKLPEIDCGSGDATYKKPRHQYEDVYNEYLHRTLSVYLTDIIGDVTKVRPKDPIQWISNALRRKAENMFYQQEQLIFLEFVKNVNGEIQAENMIRKRMMPVLKDLINDNKEQLSALRSEEIKIIKDEGRIVKQNIIDNRNLVIEENKKVNMELHQRYLKEKQFMDNKTLVEMLAKARNNTITGSDSEYSSTELQDHLKKISRKLHLRQAAHMAEKEKERKEKEKMEAHAKFLSGQNLDEMTKRFMAAHAESAKRMGVTTPSRSQISTRSSMKVPSKTKLPPIEAKKRKASKYKKLKLKPEPIRDWDFLNPDKMAATLQIEQSIMRGEFKPMDDDTGVIVYVKKTWPAIGSQVITPLERSASVNQSLEDDTGNPNIENPNTETPIIGTPFVESPPNTGSTIFGTPNIGSTIFGTPNIGTPNIGNSRKGTLRIGTPNIGNSRKETLNIGTPRSGSSRKGTLNIGTPRSGSSRKGTLKIGTPRSGSSNIGIDGQLEESPSSNNNLLTLNGDQNDDNFQNI